MIKTWQRIKNDPKLLKTYFIRERVIQTIRDFFKKGGFHEVFTPIMVPVPSIEPNLEVFETQLRTSQGLKKRAFLISSPEYAHKRLLAAGVGSLFEITRSFRNEEEVSRLHSPEFTILEWYRVNADYKDTMKDFEQLFLEIIGHTEMLYQGQEYDLSLPWPRITVAEAFQRYSSIDTEILLDEKKLIEVGKERGYKVESSTTWEQMFYQIFLNEIETKIRDSHKPTFIYDYPLAQASLSRPKKEDLGFAERFEVFLAGVELGNCFSELTDAEAQHKRFEADKTLRQAQGKLDFPIDEDFVEALRSGMPMSSGIAVGVDRLVMLAADVPSVSDTIFFPDNELFSL
ncbi:MAG: tRNA synthetase class II (D K and N) [Candidatus Woesebacteria bacterium GW2011_GWA2_40_7]|uniref:tRNA synthetase class II (D K and N) n=3 Tax=Candidatus Woeseibacteriota TaxID=1752722 RepID=A0A0G0XWD5_9BACT|nr:MAG: tRNA synthetase class II (D K and N) [Candidatus Woesebacteria bacterium GW2011_GWB1_39_10]KKR72733.1 MAG: tRNA synthetase class II (D K and N) [Candidatus Woesebacteria bacterium GW2011_GWA2_40_7]KKR92207.1 MAG: tRNA synthetase class II (D K and N) [Candidatus Woesebacteria bacterium GW2011_GWA1_41_13b]